MKKPTIMIVDDEITNCRLLEHTLESQYNVISALSAEVCLDQLNNIKPDIFLLDVHMPAGIDGFQLCKKIRSMPQFNDTLIIFLSALDGLDQKLAGYQAGADDYVTKPIELEILLIKLRHQFNRITQASKTSNDAMAIAMTAMSHGSEIGQVNLFFENLNNCQSYEHLSKQLIDVCSVFGVNAAIQLRPSESHINASTTGIVNTLESELMISAQGTERIFTFGHRCLFNFKNATLLVRRKPEDLEKAGRYRDHLASVMIGVEARMRSLHTEISLKSQNETLAIQALQQTHTALDEILVQFKKYDLPSTEIIESLIADMHMAFSHLDLHQEQEDYLLEIINNRMEQITELSSGGIELDKKFEDVIKLLNQLSYIYPQLSLFRL